MRSSKGDLMVKIQCENQECEAYEIPMATAEGNLPQNCSRCGAVMVVVGRVDDGTTVQNPNAKAITDAISSQLDTLEAAARNWATLTPAQKDGATRIAVRNVARLGRLALNRLDTTGD